MKELPKNVLFVSGWLDVDDLEGIVKESVVINENCAIYFERTVASNNDDILKQVFGQIRDYDNIVEMADKNKEKVVVVYRSNIDISFMLNAYMNNKSAIISEDDCRLYDDILSVVFSNKDYVPKTTVLLLPFKEEYFKKIYLKDESINNIKKEFLRTLFMLYYNFRVHGVDREIATNRESAVSIINKKIHNLYNQIRS